MDNAKVEKAAYLAKAASLHTLTEYPEWDLYRLALEEMEKRCIEGMLAGTEDTFHYSRGWVMGVRTALNLPATISHNASKL